MTLTGDCATNIEVETCFQRNVYSKLVQFSNSSALEHGTLIVDITRNLSNASVILHVQTSGLLYPLSPYLTFFPFYLYQG